MREEDVAEVVGDGDEHRAAARVREGLRVGLGPLLFAVAFRKPVEALRAALVTALVEEHGFSREEAEAAVVLGAYLDDVVVGLPAELAARPWTTSRLSAPLFSALALILNKLSC